MIRISKPFILAALLLFLLLVTNPAYIIESLLPFQHTVKGNFDAESVHAADMHSDFTPRGQRKNEMLHNEPTPDNSRNIRQGVPSSILQLTKSDGVREVIPCQILTYTLLISNTGNEVLTGLVLSDLLPDYTTFITASHGATEKDGIVTWPTFQLNPLPTTTATLTESSIKLGPLAVLRMSIQMDKQLPPGIDYIVNNAWVTDNGSNTGVPITATANDINILLTEPNLHLTLHDGVNEVSPGQIITYTLTVINNGNQGATGIVLSDTLPDDTTFINGSHGGEETNGIVTWPAFELDAKAAITRSLAFAIIDPFLRSNPETLFVNHAQVADDGNNSNDLGIPRSDAASDINTLISPRSHFGWNNLHRNGIENSQTPTLANVTVNPPQDSNKLSSDSNISASTDCPIEPVTPTATPTATSTATPTATPTATSTATTTPTSIVTISERLYLPIMIK